MFDRPALTALLLVSLAAASHPAAAQTTFSDNALFTADGLSVWNSGPGFHYDSGNRFFGKAWNIGDSVGGIERVCIPFTDVCASAGAEIGARTNGAAGINYGVKVDSGTFAVQYPSQVNFALSVGDYHTVGRLTSVDSVTISSSILGLPGGVTTGSVPGIPSQVRLPTLQVTGPTVQAYADLVADFHAFAGATVCVGVCYGPAIGPIDINGSRELASINRNGNHEIHVLDQTVSAKTSVSALNGLVNASFNIPNLDSSSRQTPGGFSGGTLTSTRRDNVATVNANLAQIAADAVGLPIPLSGKLGPIGYNLLQADAGASIDLKQTIRLTPHATGTYFFSSLVQPVINGVDTGGLTRTINFNVGDDVTFRPGLAGSVGFVPIIDLNAAVENETDLVLGGNVDVKALGVNVAGLTLGPLFNEHLGGPDLGTIPLLHQTFNDYIGTETLPAITIDFANCRTFYHLSELDNPAALCASSGYRDIGPEASQVPGTFADGQQRFDCPAHLVGTPQACENFGYPSTSPYAPGPLGSRTFLDNTTALNFAPTTPGASTTDPDALTRLHDLGYTGPPLGPQSTFVIPDGDPLSSFPVPEPGSLAVLALGLAGLAMARRARPAHEKPV